MKFMKHETIKEIKSLIFIVFIAMMIRILLVEPYFVPSGSMRNTLLDGDYIFATKYSYGYSKFSIPFSPNLFSGRVLPVAPERGDVIIFRPPRDMEIRYIKRLIGLPGDKIQVINNVIHINDVPIERKEIGQITDENGISYTKYEEILPNKGGVVYTAYHAHDVSKEISYHLGNTRVFYVPEGHYFFMGDNRDHSADSRFELGFVPFENFIAKAQFTWLSMSELLWTSDVTITNFVPKVFTWIKSIRYNRFFKSIYPST